MLYYNPFNVVILSEGWMSTSLQVWVNAETDSNGRVHFAADSDSELTRGLAAVLVEALSGLTPKEVLQVRCTTPSGHAWHGIQVLACWKGQHLTFIRMWHTAPEAQEVRVGLVL